MRLNFSLAILGHPRSRFLVPLLVIFTVSLPGKSKCQTIDSLGIFHPRETNRLYAVDDGIIKRPYSEDLVSRNKMYKILLQKVDATIFNLENDSTYLKDSYSRIWSPDFFNSYLAELKVLSTFFQHPDQPGNTLHYLPQTNEIAQLLKDDPFILDNGTLYPKLNRKEFLLYKSDKLAAYLLSAYMKSYEKDSYLKAVAMDAGYISGWRSLEKWYKLTIETQKALSSLQKDLYKIEIEDVVKLESELKKIEPAKLPVVNWLKDGTFVKNWLWLNNGLIRINPLPSTSPDKRYPASELNLFLTERQKKLQDSLEKLNAFDVFRTTKKVYNKVILPVSNSKTKPDTLMMQYDGASNYRPVSTIKDQYLKNEIQLLIPVYNIPAEKNVTINSYDKTLPYESRMTTLLNSMAEGLGTISSLGVSNAGTIAKITDLINLDAKIYRKETIQPADSGNRIGEKSNSFYKTKNITKPNIKSSGSPGSGSVNAVYLNGTLVRLTNKDLHEDKKRMLWTLQNISNNESRQTESLNYNAAVFEELISEFVKSDHYYFLDYSSDSNIEQGIFLMVGRFNSYKTKIKNIAAKIQNVADSIVAKQNSILPYLRISNRSLPPRIAEEKVDTVPTFYSKIFAPEMPAPPKKMIYTLTEAGVDNEKVKTKEVVKETFKVIKTQRFDLSVGLGYTFGEYNITSNDGSALPTTALGDNFQFQAGVHWYFVHRLNKLNDKLFENPDERFSLYLGLSLKKALDNYFTGLSYDITPGVKIIAGVHFYKNQRFKIINNEVAEKASGISTAGFFTSFHIEPVTIAKAIGLFK